MSEAWHQHLQNLSLWEQIDRFFNPGKYSCSMVVNDNLYHIFLIAIVVTVCVGIGTLVWWRLVLERDDPNE